MSREVCKTDSGDTSLDTTRKKETRVSSENNKIIEERIKKIKKAFKPLLNKFNTPPAGQTDRGKKE